LLLLSLLVIVVVVVVVTVLVVMQLVLKGKICLPYKPFFILKGNY